MQILVSSIIIFVLHRVNREYFWRKFIQILIYLKFKVDTGL